MVTDCESENGNLLLKVVLRTEGSSDPEAEEQLGEMATWSDVNGETIYGTRPWQIYGEGATNSKGGGFHEDLTYCAKDIRFTNKGDTLYAVALGVPKDGRLRIRSLVTTATSGNTITAIPLQGSANSVKWTHNNPGRRLGVLEGHFEGAGTYDISAGTATQNAGTQVQIEVGDQKFTATIAGTSDWNTYATAKLGTVTLHTADDTIIAVRASDAKT